jgi:salicylate hydroxylase
VREHVFPDHSIRFTGTSTSKLKISPILLTNLGTTIFRVLIPVTSISHIPNLTPSTTWWHGPTGHFYGSLVDDPSETPKEEQMFEIAARKVVDPATATGKKFSWGVPATKERVESLFTVRELFFKLKFKGSDVLVLRANLK